MPIDDIRVLSNRFSGGTAIAIAEAFYGAGAEVELLLSGTHLQAPEWILTRRTDSFEAYRDACIETSADLGIFSAAVADYQPAEAATGKLASGESEINLCLRPTSKVVAAWRSAHPQAKLVSFKLEAGLSDSSLLAIAKGRVGDHSDLVVANHSEGGELFLVDAQGQTRVSRQALPAGLIDWASSALV